MRCWRTVAKNYVYAMKCSKFSFLFHIFNPTKVELVCIWSSTWLALNRGSRFVCTFPDPRNAAEARTSPPWRLKESACIIIRNSNFCQNSYLLSN